MKAKWIIPQRKAHELLGRIYSDHIPEDGFTYADTMRACRRAYVCGRIGKGFLPYMPPGLSDDMLDITGMAFAAGVQDERHSIPREYVAYDLPIQ